LLKLNKLLVPSAVVVAEFACGEGVGPNANFEVSTALVPNELCPPVAKTLILVPNPVPNPDGFDDASDVAVLDVGNPENPAPPVPNPNGFDDASDVAVLGVGILLNPENPEGTPLLAPGLIFEKLKISFFTSLGACEAPLLNPKVNLGATVVAENTGGFATSGAAVGARDDVGKTGGAEVGAAGLFWTLKSNFSAAVVDGAVVGGTG